MAASGARGRRGVGENPSEREEPPKGLSLRRQLAHRAGLEVEVPLDFEAEFSLRSHQLLQAERPELVLKALDVAVEDVRAVELDAVPGPTGIGIEELHLEYWVRLVGCFSKLRKALEDIARRSWSRVIVSAGSTCSELDASLGWICGGRVPAQAPRPGRLHL